MAFIFEGMDLKFTLATKALASNRDIITNFSELTKDHILVSDNERPTTPEEQSTIGGERAFRITGVPSDGTYPLRGTGIFTYDRLEVSELLSKIRSFIVVDEESLPTTVHEALNDSFFKLGFEFNLNEIHNSPIDWEPDTDSVITITALAESSQLKGSGELTLVRVKDISTDTVYTYTGQALNIGTEQWWLGIDLNRIYDLLSSLPVDTEAPLSESLSRRLVAALNGALFADNLSFAVSRGNVQASSSFIWETDSSKSNFQHLNLFNCKVVYNGEMDTDYINANVVSKYLLKLVLHDTTLTPAGREIWLAYSNPKDI